jgi:hypothetical protein
VNENNTNGGPGNEAKGPRPLDFNGTEIRPGLWAIEDDELQRIGNAAYQAGRGEREGEVAQLREALELASQQQAKIAAVLGLEPGEDVLAEVQGVAEILRKSCAALGIYAEHAADLPSEIGSLRSLSSLRDDVVKALGFGAVDNFSLFFGRAINAEVDDATRRIDAARLRAVEALKQQDAEHGEAILKAVEAAEIRTRKACADQINAAQAMIDRATKEHEEERVKLHARIAKAERDLDESRSAHAATLDSLRQTERNSLRAAVRLREILGAEEGEQTHAAAERIVRDRNESRDAAAKAALRLSAAEAVNRGLQGHIDDTIAALGGACGQSAVDLAKRVVRERDESRASHANTVGSLTDFKGIANAQRAELVEIAELTAKQESETFADAVRRVVHERTRALQDARWWKSYAEGVKAQNSNLATILGAQPTEATTEAARRVVAERDALQAKVCPVWGTAFRKIVAGEMVSDRDVMPVVTFGVGQW